MEIPKAFITVVDSFAVRPTEEQLMKYYSEFGYTDIAAVVEDQGSWDFVIREWFVNTNYQAEYKQFQLDNNIYHLDLDCNEEEVDIVTDEQWNDHDEKWGAIY
jgi:hypothetical protein